MPAREGTLRVLRAASAAGAQRVVVTSSVAAIGGGAKAATRRSTEEDWTDLAHAKLTPYARSKTIAERAAWDFADEAGATEPARGRQPRRDPRPGAERTTAPSRCS